MPISTITIENFKGIGKPVKVDLKPITLLFGPNSAGKSTIVQALHYGREIFERQNLNPDRTLLGGESVDLGGFENLVHQHDLSLPVVLRFGLDLTDEDLPGYDESQYVENQDTPGNVGLSLSGVPAQIQTMEVEITIRWSEQQEKPYIELYQVQANNHYLLGVRASADDKSLRFDINPFNPIFLPEEVTPQEAEEAIFQVYEAEDDEPQHKIGVLCWAWWELTEGFDGANRYSFDISGGLESVLPEEHASITFNLPERDFPVRDSQDKVALFEQAAAKAEYEDFTHNLATLLESLIAGPCASIRDGLKSFCYVGPLRELPLRGYKAVSSPDISRWAKGLAAYDTLFFGEDDFITRVNAWLVQKERLNAGYSVEVKQYRELEVDDPLMLAVLQERLFDEELDIRNRLLALPVLRRLLIRDEAQGLELAPQDIGVGISQMLPVVVAALFHRSGFVAIEQPELHIHPALQVAMGDLFVEQVNKSTNLFFILETHSEHMLLRMLRRMEETHDGKQQGVRKLTPEQISIYYAATDQDGVKLTTLEVDETGEFVNDWPEGFFEEREEELLG